MEEQIRHEKNKKSFNGIPVAQVFMDLVEDEKNQIGGFPLKAWEEAPKRQRQHRQRNSDLAISQLNQSQDLNLE